MEQFLKNMNKEIEEKLVKISKLNKKEILTNNFNAVDKLNSLKSDVKKNKKKPIYNDIEGSVYQMAIEAFLKDNPELDEYKK